MPRGKRKDPTAAVLAKVIAEMGFDIGLIATASGLPRATVKDIVQRNGPWRHMPQNELYELARIRLVKAVNSVVDDLAIKAIAKLEEKLKTASYTELIEIAGVALK